MDLVNIEKDISKLSIEQLTQLDLELRGLDQEPVPIKQFLDDPYYLGKYFSSGFREYWYDPLQTIFSQPGKSNYFLVFLSGCLGGDTLIPLLSKEVKTIRQMAIDFYNGIPQQVISWNTKFKVYQPDRVVSVFSTGVKEVYRILLDTGASIICTSSHPFLTIDNTWISIDTGLKFRTPLYPKFSVMKVEYLGEQEVFDITTEKNHNFCLNCGLVAHNSIGRGKSTTAMAACLYNLYSLLCYKDPQSEFNLVANDKILFAFMNATQSLADKALLGKYQGMLNASPYFQRILADFYKKTKHKKIPTDFPKNIGIVSGSRITHTLGLNIFSAIISEAAFGIVNGQMMELFDSIMARQQSRFMSNGKSAGVIWVDSSEGDKGSELAVLRDKYKGKPGVYVDTGPLWQVKFEDYTDCRFFYLFTGNEKFQPRILDPYESQEDRELLNTGPFIVVPEVHRSAFEADIMRAMRDLAGIPTSSSFSLFRNLEKLNAAMTYQPIFEDIVRLDFDDQYDQITDHCQYLDYFANLPYASHPRFLHLDLAISGDKLGIACCFIMGMKEVTVNLLENTKAGTSLMPRVCYDFAFSIEAKSGQQIPLDKIRVFLNWLNNNKVSIGGVSADSFNSADMLQSVKHMGFHSQVLSVDRGSDNYLSFRNAIYEERVILPRNKLLAKELINLEMSADMKKVDHPSVFPDGTVGSKDCADACCGAYNLAVLRSAETAYLMMPESKPIQPVTNTQLLTGAIKNLWGKKPVPDPYEEYLRRQEENYTPQKNPFNFWNKPV